MKYDVYGIGNAIVDIVTEVEPDFFDKNGVEKGVMTLVDEKRQQELMQAIDMKRSKLSGGGSAGISVNTRWASDDPGDRDWGENFSRPGSVTITGDTTAQPWRVHIEARWQESDTIRLSTTVDVVCTETYAEQ